jgi:nicotinamidase/pyrazinamidase
MKALIIVDVQNDFLPGGALAVSEADAIVPTINRLMPRFDHVIATQDWHPANHGSFAANHPGRKPGEVIQLGGLTQILWPVHCVQGTRGAQFAGHLNTHAIQHVVQKGCDANIDSYSGFFDNGHRKSTGLADYLRAAGVDEVFICGVATDYCVKFTALDAVQLGFKVSLIVDACCGVNLHPEDVGNSIEEMRTAGVKVITSAQI